jgi:hypothetical protein
MTNNEDFGEYFVKKFGEHINTIEEYRLYKQQVDVLQERIDEAKKDAFVKGTCDVSVFKLFEQSTLIRQEIEKVLIAHAADAIEVLGLSTNECHGRIIFKNVNDKGKKVKDQVDATAAKFNLDGMHQVAEVLAVIETNEKEKTKAEVLVVADKIKEAENTAPPSPPPSTVKPEKQQENTPTDSDTSQIDSSYKTDEDIPINKDNKANCGRPKNGSRNFDGIDELNKLNVYTTIKHGKDTCPNCGRRLSIVGDGNKREYIHFDIQIKVTVVHRRNQVMTCNHCNNEIRKKQEECRRRNIDCSESPIFYEADIPDGVPKGRDYSWGAISILAFLTYGLNLSQNSVADYLKNSGLPITVETINSLLNDETPVVLPIVEMLHDDILRNSHAMYHVDETTYPFIKEKENETTSSSKKKEFETEDRYAFVMATPLSHPNQAVFYSLVGGRDMKTIQDNLLCFDKKEQPKMSFLSDGYGLYNRLADNLDTVDKRISCIIHTIRKFTDLINFGDLKDEKNDTTIFYLTKIQEYFTEAQKIDDLDERIKARKETVEPAIEFFMEYAQKLEGLNPQSAFVKALKYAKKEVPLLKNAISIPHAVIDNNTIERLMKPIKKQEDVSLFVRSEKGWKALMSLKSLIVSARLNGLNAAKYLYIVMCEFPYVDAEKPEEVRKYLPYSDYMKKRIKEKIGIDNLFPFSDEDGYYEGELKIRGT